MQVELHYVSSDTMIPNAKKNLHECEYFLNNMLHSRNIEEFEINFAAFVNSARNVTWVLKKEYSSNGRFNKWYLSKEKEMKNDELLSFFKDLRNKIDKEGINALSFQTQIGKFNSTKDIIDRPPGSAIVINSKGVYYLVGKGTSKEDLIPAKTNAEIKTNIFLSYPPRSHLGKDITNHNVVRLCIIYYNYLKSLVEEWTAILNEYNP